MKKNINKGRLNKGVSEVLGTVLILGMAVAIFSLLYSIVLSEEYETESPYPTVIAFIEDDYIVIEHRGGEEIAAGNKFMFELNGNNLEFEVGNSPDTKDGIWSVGERLIINLTDIHGGPDPYDLDNKDVDIFGLNKDGEVETIIFSGNLDIHPMSNIGIKCTVSDETPNVNTNILINITVTHYKGNMPIPAGLNIYFNLPDGLEHISNSTNNFGEYNNKSGNWILDELGIRKSATLSINAKVIAKGTLGEYTQLALLLDGSGSISTSDWDTMRDGIALAITNGCIPHNEMVELTIIQFGGSSHSSGPFWAQVELGGPIVLNNSNYNHVASQIQGMNQIGGGTSMSCAFRLAADVLSGDPNGYLVGTDEEGMASIHSDWPRQIVNLVTDGKPNIIYNHGDRYGGYFPGFENQYEEGKTNTEMALEYYETLIPIEEDDEIDVEAIGANTDIPWLRDFICRPQPGYDTWPPIGPGWVRYIANYEEFANTIDEQFEFIFSGIKLKADMIQSSPIDISIKVNSDITIKPED